jgi:hypothetical protein
MAKSRTVSHKHPDTIYIKKEQIDNETYFTASDNLENLAELNVPVLVSKYKLVSTHTLITKPVLQPEVTHHGTIVAYSLPPETD